MTSYGKGRFSNPYFSIIGFKKLSKLSTDFNLVQIFVTPPFLIEYLLKLHHNMDSTSSW